MGDDPFTGTEQHLWEQYLNWKKMAEVDRDGLAENAREIADKIQIVAPEKFKSPWNVHLASHDPERRFSELLFARADLFESFVRMPNVGGYSFPYSFKPAKAARTHVANENFNPDFFLRLAGTHEILVVEVKSEGDDSARNRAKCRDGLRHFESLNDRLMEAGELWRYRFFMLAPDDYISFFDKLRDGRYAGWRSGLMQELTE
jgi:type III restriction enzyme